MAVASEEKISYFNLVPTEVVELILGKILDVKTLCICCSVCKSFAAHVIQTTHSSVSLQIEHPIVSPFLDCVVWPLGMINFLKKLHYVESVTIQFPPILSRRSRRSRSRSGSRKQMLCEHSVCWKSDSFGFILIFSESRVGYDEIKGITKKKKGGGEFTKEECQAFFGLIEKYMFDFQLRFNYLKHLVRGGVFPNLKNVWALDYMKQGSLVLDEQGIACMKKDNSFHEYNVKLWFAHELKLPFSRDVMENVVIVCTKQIGATYGLMVENSFEDYDDEKEVAMTMMKKKYVIYNSPSFSPGVGRFTIADYSMSPLMFVNVSSLWPGYKSSMRRQQRLATSSD